ncbi:MAG: FtsW/RodA/SpoVE family cell cycle protein [Parcubacteria group bacterium]
MISKIKQADWILNAAIFFLAAAGLLMLFSGSSDLFVKQVIFLAIGLVFLLAMPFLNLKHLVNYRWLIFLILALSVVLLVLTYFFGVEVNGSKSWLDFNFFRLQPSEFAKVALITILAAFFSGRHISIKRPGVILGSFAYFAAPTALILIEPDLGSALILFGIWFGFLVVAGLPIKYIAAGIALFAVLGVVAWNFGLKDYQKDRILAVFNPEEDPLGVNYNVIQSKNAIGSAGFLGKGFRQGEIVQLGFLPAAQTDFAFASFTEEWGILGGGLVIIAFAIMMWRISLVGIKAEDNFSKFICLGTMIFLGLQFAVNMGSVLGFTPVVGVAFPFLSAGGSNLIASMFLLGIVQNIAQRRTA